ncbi:MAG: hypothetical protein AAB250_11510 [Bdellovibrionota bacterium]
MESGIKVYEKLLEVRAKESTVSFEKQIRSLSESDLVSLAVVVFMGRLMYDGLASDDPASTRGRASSAVQKMGAKSKEPIVSYLCSLPVSAFGRYFNMVKTFGKVRSE